MNDRGKGGGYSYKQLVDPSLTLKMKLVVEIVQQYGQATVSLLVLQH